MSTFAEKFEEAPEALKSELLREEQRSRWEAGFGKYVVLPAARVEQSRIAGVAPQLKICFAVFPPAKPGAEAGPNRGPLFVDDDEEACLDHAWTCNNARWKREECDNGEARQDDGQLARPDQTGGQ